MPTYDYECDACGHTMELFQGINDPVKKKCPECGKNKLKRLFGTGAAIVFKGSGFYQTDYRSDGYKKAAKEDKKSKSDSKSSDSSDAKKSDSSTTPAAKKSGGDGGSGGSGSGGSGSGGSGSGGSGGGTKKSGGDS